MANQASSCSKECPHVPGWVSETPLRGLRFTRTYSGPGIVCLRTGGKGGYCRSVCRGIFSGKGGSGSRPAQASAYREAEEAEFQVAEDRIKQDLQEVA